MSNNGYIVQITSKDNSLYGYHETMCSGYNWQEQVREFVKTIKASGNYVLTIQKNCEVIDFNDPSKTRVIDFIVA